MKVFDSVKKVKKHLSEDHIRRKTIGFVPTMGALHDGHLELMKRAKEENDLLAVSVFVNPIQFNNKEDLEKYPRDLNRDKQLLESVGCDILFAPTVDEVYPEDMVVEKFDFGKLESVMEGAFRPGHFNGVAVVVKRLFNIVEPTTAYFGEKDFQQLAIIRKLVEMEKMPIKIVPCSIVREADGLAMSSRNERLAKKERDIAPFIYQTLQAAVGLKTEKSVEDTKQWVVDRFKEEPAFTLEYFEIADDDMLQPVSEWDEKIGTIGFVAAYLGKVRLIDNIRFY